MGSWECRCGRINRERDLVCGLCRGDRAEMDVAAPDSSDLLRSASNEITSALGYPVRIEVIGLGRKLTAEEARDLAEEARRDAADALREQRRGLVG